MSMSLSLSGKRIFYLVIDNALSLCYLKTDLVSSSSYYVPRDGGKLPVEK